MRRFLVLLAGSMLLVTLAACTGGTNYQPPAYNINDCFWSPWKPNC